MKLEAKRQDAALRVWIGSWEAGCGAGSLDLELGGGMRSSDLELCLDCELGGGMRRWKLGL